MLDFSPGPAGCKKIGLFDSGVGGLTVLRRLTATLPGAQYVYFGDTARLPYGNRSRGEIGQFVREIIGFLSDFEPDAVVMACNTSAALAHHVALATARTVNARKSISGGHLQVYSLIEPMAEQIAARSFVRAGVMATRATVESNAFGLALEAANFSGSHHAVACPKLVPLIESGRLGEADVEEALGQALRQYLLELAGCDAIVLGCTHFPFVAGRIADLVAGELAESFPGGVTILDPAVGIADLLGQNMTPDMVTSRGSVQIFTSGNASEFRRSAERCLGFNVGPVTSVDLSANLFAPAILVPPVFA